MECAAVVDTNVISYLFRKDTRGLGYLPILTTFEYLIISFQTMAELSLWASSANWGRRRRADLAFFVGDYEVAFPDLHTCNLWAEIRSERARQGTPIHPEDAWIAATAVDLACPLITHNSQDFPGISGLRVLTTH